MAFIDNAKDYWSESDRKAHTEEKKREFENLGFEFEELDLRDYFGKQSELLNKLSNISLVWGSGGNTFLLRRAMAHSGLDNILVDKLANDEFAYGGSSAGSIMATPSLHGAENEIEDIPGFKTEGYYDIEPIWEGLNLVPFYIVPHYRESSQSDSYAMAKYLQEKDWPHHKLADGQAIVVNGEETEFLR